LGGKPKESSLDLEFNWEKIMSKTLIMASWVCRIVVAVILLQTLFFKFTGAEESKYIFTKLMGAEFEAVGRIGSGAVELVAAILLLIPGTGWLGALIALGTISGAIFSHLTKLGIVVKDDGGLLFALAVVVFVLSAVVLFIHRGDLPILGRVFEVKNNV
jgi:putative oxidoreductase